MFNTTPRGQKTSLTCGNGWVTSWTHKHSASNFRITNRTTSSNQQNLTSGYGNNGNVTSITDSLFTGGRTFGYDDLNRTATGKDTFGINRATQNWSYAYSAIGTLTISGISPGQLMKCPYPHRWESAQRLNPSYCATSRRKKSGQGNADIPVGD